MAGFTPPPGFYVQNDTYLYSGAAQNEIPLGGRIIADVDATLVANLTTLLWVTKYEVLGGNLSFTATVPFGGPDISARLSPTPLGISDDAFTIGDPVLGGFVGWHDGNLHWQTGVSLNIPVGNYRDGQIANMSFNHFAADLYGSVTWLDQTTGHELSAAAGFTFNAEDSGDQVPERHRIPHRGGRHPALRPGLRCRPRRLFLQQLTPDTGAGVPRVLGGFEGRVAASARRRG